MKITSGMCWRFAKTLVVVAVAVVLRKAIEGWTGAQLPTFITFYPVVMFTALSLGLGAGLLATGASMLMVDYFVDSPGQLGNWSLGEAVGQGLFTCLGVAMSLFAHRYRQMQQRLETLVAERTSELDQRKAELKESQKQEARERSLMDAVLNALPIGVAVTDASGGTIRSNATYNTIWGEQRPETASVEDYADYTAWWDDTDRPVLPGEWASARAIRGETVIGQVLKIRRFDGSEAFVINSASPVYDADGVIAGSVVAIQDITALKKVEAELRNSEQKMKALTNTANESIWQFGLDGEIISANVTAARRIGLSVEELQGRKWQDIIPPALVDSRTRKVEEVIRTKAPVTFEDERAGMFFEHCANPVCDEQGTVTSVAIFSRDITVRRQAEEKQRNNEERLRLALQAANAGAWEWNLETNENIWSEELWAVYGIEPHSCEPSYESWLKTIHPDDRVRVGQAVRDAACHGRELAVEWRVCGDDGAGERWLMSRGQPQSCANGSVDRYIGIVLDITARKKAEKELYDKDTRLQGAYHELQVTFVEMKAKEEELQERNRELGLLWEQAQRSERSLRESEKRFRDIVDITADWIWEIDLNGSYTFASGRVKELLGYEPEELLGRTPFDLMPPDEAKRVRAEFKTVLACRDMVLDYLNVNIHKNGELRFIQTSGVPIYNSEGEVCGYRGLDKDVTERKRAEQHIKESEELLRFHMENSPMAVIEWDSNFIVTRWTGESERMFGWSAEETVGKAITELDMIVEDDIPLVKETVARLTDGVSRQVISTNRNYTKSRSVRHCTWYNSVLLDQQGRMKSVMSKVIDITDRVAAEERLDLLSETASRLLLSESPQEVVEALCSKVMTALNCHVFFNFLVDAEQNRLHLNACSGIPEDERLRLEWLDFGTAVCGCVARDACRIVAENIPDSADPRTELVKSYGITAYACHPLMAQDRVLGTLSFGSRTKPVFSDDDLALMKAVSDHVAIAMERMQTAQALYKSHDELEQRVVERTHELEVSVKQLQEEIGERTRAEKRLQRLNRLYAVLSETNQTIVRSTDRDSLFHDFCRIAVEYGGFLLSWVGLVDQESGEIRNVAAFGATGYLEGIRVTRNNDPQAFGPTGVAVREGTFAICNDFQGSVSTKPWHERGKAFGVNSSAAIAVREGGRVIGALTLYAAEMNYFDRQHVELLQQMGADVSFALDNMIKERLRLAAEQTLREETLQRLQAVEALRKQEHIMIQQNRQAAMGEMIGNIAHQWRQPLNTLGLLVQRLGFFYGSASFNKEFMDTSVTKSMEIINYMSHTIDDFRTFFATDRERTEFRINETISKALTLVEASFKDRRIRLERDEAEDVVICGYPNEYAQVLLNIFINAKDAIIERTVESPWLKISVSSENGMSLVTIADNAGGVPEEIIDKIFDPYFTTKGPQQGTGVGLFMAKSIIETNMGGRLSVRNTGEGAEFRIEVQV